MLQLTKCEPPLQNKWAWSVAVSFLCFSQVITAWLMQSRKEIDRLHHRRLCSSLCTVVFLTFNWYIGELCFLLSSFISFGSYLLSIRHGTGLDVIPGLDLKSLSTNQVDHIVSSLKFKAGYSAFYDASLDTIIFASCSSGCTIYGYRSSSSQSIMHCICYRLWSCFVQYTLLCNVLLGFHIR